MAGSKSNTVTVKILECGKFPTTWEWFFDKYEYVLYRKHNNLYKQFRNIIRRSIRGGHRIYRMKGISESRHNLILCTVRRDRNGANMYEQ